MPHLRALSNAASRPEAVESRKLSRPTSCFPDSTSTVTQTGATVQVQFTSDDGFAYAMHTSSNLLDWTTVSTNYPANGSFNFLDAPLPGSPRRFYRSILQP